MFEKYFTLQENGCYRQDAAVIHYREDETMHVEARDDHVTVIFSTTFSIMALFNDYHKCFGILNDTKYQLYV